MSPKSARARTKNIPHLLLASTSPRRIELLRYAGLQFKSVSPGTEEIVKKNEKPIALVKRLAKEKAEAAILKYLKSNSPLCLVLAADTIVVSPLSKILGKPKSEKDAERMLASLSGKTHSVYTGYCLLEIEDGKVTQSLIRVIQSKVKMQTLSPSRIRAYVKTGEPMDKAGAYGAQGIGMTLIESIHGSYTNIVGLPVAQVLSDLKDFFSYEPC